MPNIFGIAYYPSYTIKSVPERACAILYLNKKVIMSSSSSLLSGITIYHIDKINPVMYDICDAFITYQCDAVSFYVNTFGTLERDVGFYNNFTQEDSGQRPTGHLVFSMRFLPGVSMIL